jgi:predicted PurR-regulated permease PerM
MSEKRAGRLSAVEAGRPSAVEIWSWILAGLGLFLVLHLHLLTAFLAGLLVYELVHIMAPLLQRRLFGERARMVAVALLAAFIVGVISAAIFGVIGFLRSEGGSLTALIQKMADILEHARGGMPPWIVDYLPTSLDDMRTAVTDWLHEHSSELRLAGAETGRALAHILIGMIIGAMMSLREARESESEKPLARALEARAGRVGDAFRRVVFAQVRISLLNTFFTAIYLLIALPLFGVHLPFAKTMVAVTFVVGLLPVIGNLISNSIIVVVSLANSLTVAIASLVFLIVVHKLEYFLNARIVGSRIHAHAWELLIAMLAMEAAFGLPGVVAAPIYYAYVKAELTDRGLI